MADDDFSTGAELEITVSQSSLSDARDTIESELGDLEVGVDAVVSGNRSGMQPRDPSSGQFMSIEGVEQRVVNTNESLDGLLQTETERWELDKLRNDYLEELAERGGVAGGGGGALAGLRTAAVGVGTAGAASGTAAGVTLASIFGLNAAFGERSNTDIIASSFMQNIGSPTSMVGDIGSQLGSSLAEGAAEEFDWPELPDLSTETEWPDIPDIPEPDWLDDLTITDEQRTTGIENRMREEGRAGRSGIEDVEFTREQRARGNENRQREQQASRRESRGVNVDASVDVRVEQGQSFEDIADEAVDRVEREAIEPLRRQIQRGLGGDV